MHRTQHSAHGKEVTVGKTDGHGRHMANDVVAEDKTDAHGHVLTMKKTDAHNPPLGTCTEA